MKKSKEEVLKSNEEKPVLDSKPQVNKFKKSEKGGVNSNSIANIITSATERTRPRAGGGLANEGTNVSYDEER